MTTLILQVDATKMVSGGILIVHSGLLRCYQLKKRILGSVA